MTDHKHYLGIMVNHWESTARFSTTVLHLHDINRHIKNVSHLFNSRKNNIRYYVDMLIAKLHISSSDHLNLATT